MTHCVASGVVPGFIVLSLDSLDVAVQCGLLAVESHIISLTLRLPVQIVQLVKGTVATIPKGYRGMRGTSLDSLRGV